MPAVTINAPEFFRRADFQAWLNASVSSLTGGPRATWHTLDSPPTDCSDTFIMHDGEDGSDYDQMFPDDIQTEILLRCKQIGFTYGIIRLTNLAE